MSNSVKYRFLSLAVIAVMSIALAACGGDSSNGTGGGGSTNMSNSDLLKAAATNMKSAKSYHIDLNGTASGQQIVFGGDVDVANKNSSLSITAAGQDVKVVSIGDTVYLSSDGGKTFANAGSSGASITSGMSQFTGMWNSFDTTKVPSSDALKDGSPATESIDGTTCKHMTANASDLASLSAGSGASAGGTVDLWAAQDGSYICQVKVVTTDSTTNITMKWSKLNSIPAITAPPTSN